MANAPTTRGDKLPSKPNRRDKYPNLKPPPIRQKADRNHPMLVMIRSRITQEREARAMTQRELAERAGVHYATINKMEMGHRGISWEDLYSIAKAFDMEPADLLRSAKFKGGALSERADKAAYREWPIFSDFKTETRRVLPSNNSLPDSAIAGTLRTDDMDMLAPPEMSVVVIAPENTALRDGKMYVIEAGGSVRGRKFVESEDGTAAFVDCSAEDKQPILLSPNVAVLGRILRIVIPL
jgi:transcriptional regulator with XRE-family HTH domain